MKKGTVFALFVITILSFALIAGLTQADTDDTERENLQPLPNQNDISISSNDTKNFSNANLSSQLQDLINSNYFKRLTTQWSAEKATQDPGYRFEDVANTRGTITTHAKWIETYSGGPPQYGTGYATSINNIVLAPDSAYTRFHTETYRAYPETDEAIITVMMQSALSGDVWLRGYNGQYSSSDVYVFASNSLNPSGGMSSWMGIGYAHFTSSSPQDVFVGTATTAYKYLAIFVCAYTSPFTAQNDVYVDCVTIIHDTGSSGGDPGGNTPGPDPGVSSANVLVSSTQEPNGDVVTSWVCGDDNGTYYCYITGVYVDTVWHHPEDYGDIYSGSIIFTDGQSHTVNVVTQSIFCLVTFSMYIDDHNIGAGPELWDIWYEYTPVWMERDGPVYCTGTNLFGGGPITYQVFDPYQGNYPQYIYCKSILSYKPDGTNLTEHYEGPVSHVLLPEIYSYIDGTMVDIYYSTW